MASGSAAELAVLFAATCRVKIAGHDVKIRAFGLDCITQYAEFIGPAYEYALKFIESVAKGGEAVDAIIDASIVDPPDGWSTSALSPYDRATLILEIQELNEPGFQQAHHLATRVSESLIRMAGDGPIRSNSSNPTATPTLDSSPLAPQAYMSTPSAAPNGAASAI